MNKSICGSFNGTGAAVYLCLGFIPDFIQINSVEDADAARLEWNRGFRSSEQIGGIVVHTASGLVPVLKTAGAGVEDYEGGDLMTSSNQTSTTNGEGVYLEKDETDYKAIDIADGSATIDTWTLDTAGNRTGHFNNDVTGTYIGEGSRILIGTGTGENAKWYTITALTAGQGISADEVTLDRAAPSGAVLAITNMYDFRPVPLGAITKAGFKLNVTSVLNVNDELQSLLAGQCRV